MSFKKEKNLKQDARTILNNILSKGIRKSGSGRKS